MIAILGPGAVGGFVAGALARGGEPPVVVAREPTVRLIARAGLAISSVRFGDLSVRPRAVAVLADQADVLVVATKATALADALGRVAVAPALVVPLLNGLEHMARLRERFGPARVAAGAIRIESHRPAPGTIVHTSPSVRVDLAADEDSLRGRLRAFAATLERAGIPVTIGASEARILWSKLVRLSALALTTSAFDTTIGTVRTRERATLEACVREAAAVANAEGAPIDPAAPLLELDQAHAELRSSMQRDIAAGREPELDAIAGAVLRAAARHRLECPTIARLTVAVAARAGIAPPPVAARS